jgi:hypothetical protein
MLAEISLLRLEIMVRAAQSKPQTRTIENRFVPYALPRAIR